MNIMIILLGIIILFGFWEWSATKIFVILLLVLLLGDLGEISFIIKRKYDMLKNPLWKVVKYLRLGPCYIAITGKMYNLVAQWLGRSKTNGWRKYIPLYFHRIYRLLLLPLVFSQHLIEFDRLGSKRSIVAQMWSAKYSIYVVINSDKYKNMVQICKSTLVLLRISLPISVIIGSTQFCSVIAIVVFSFSIICLLLLWTIWFCLSILKKYLYNAVFQDRYSHLFFIERSLWKYKGKRTVDYPDIRENILMDMKCLYFLTSPWMPNKLTSKHNSKVKQRFIKEKIMRLKKFYQYCYGNYQICKFIDYEISNYLYKYMLLIKSLEVICLIGVIYYLII